MMDSGNDHPLVSIVVVNYNGASFLRPCLESVFAQPYRPIEVIVVDNASSDGSIAMVQREFPDVGVIRSATNLGFAEGNNVGVRKAQGEYVVLLNNDTTVDSDWLFALLETFRQVKAALVCSRVVTEGIPQRFYEMNGSINYLGYNIMRQFDDLSQIFFAGGASLMFRKALVPEPFPAEYFLYHEDVYRSWAMRMQGYDVRMSKESRVLHLGSATTKRQATARITFYQERNRILNLLLFYEGTTIMKLFPLILADIAVKLLVSVLSRQKSFVGTLRALGWLAFNPSWILSHRRAVQVQRVVGDNAILALMSADIIDEARSGKAAHFVNAVSRSYARAVGLPFHVPRAVGIPPASVNPECHATEIL